MGANITERLARGGHTVWGYDSSPAAAADVAAKGVQIADALAQLTRKLSHPRAIWIMVPAGAPVNQTIEALAQHVEKATR